MTKITNALPADCSNGFEYLFAENQSYSDYRTKVFKKNNVFISHWGLMIKNGLMPLRTAENLIGSYDNAFYFSHYKKVLEQYLVCRFGKSLPKKQYNDNRHYFTIHTPWFGYFSWFTSNLPRLIHVHEQYPDAILLLPEEISQMAYVKDSIEMFPRLSVEIVEKSHHMFIKNYVFAQVKPWTSQFILSELEMVRNLFLKNIDTKQSRSKRIYISRQKARRRTIINEQEIEEYLHSLGFESVCYEDLSLANQIAITHNADVLVSLHGAGLTNTMFMKAGSSAMELSPIPDNDSQFRFPFWRICDLLKIKYYVQFCKTVDKGEKDMYERDILVDMGEFKRIIERIM